MKMDVLVLKNIKGDLLGQGLVLHENTSFQKMCRFQYGKEEALPDYFLPVFVQNLSCLRSIVPNTRERRFFAI